MDDPSFSVSPSAPLREPSSSSYEGEDEEDLGFGNSKKQAKGKEKEDEDSKKSSEPARAAVEPERPGKHICGLFVT
jgi:hypothetical protein